MDCSDCDNVQSIVQPQDTVANVYLPTDSDDIQPIVANVTSSIDIAMDCNDPLLLAMHKLQTIASRNGFVIHDVPADGDCMYSAIVYQLNIRGIFYLLVSSHFCIHSVYIELGASASKNTWASTYYGNAKIHVYKFHLYGLQV